MDEKLELAREWLTKAMLDLKAARTISENVPQYLDGAAFHCQQAVEKAIKALLTLHDQRFGKTHDLELLIDQVQEHLPALTAFTAVAERLTSFAVEGRYPGEIALTDRTEYADLAEAAQAMCADS